MIVSFGPMSKPLSEQLSNLKSPELADEFAKAISMLWIHGILTDNEAQKAERRIIKMYEKGKL